MYSKMKKKLIVFAYLCSELLFYWLHLPYNSYDLVISFLIACSINCYIFSHVILWALLISCNLSPECAYFYSVFSTKQSLNQKTVFKWLGLALGNSLFYFVNLDFGVDFRWQKHGLILGRKHGCRQQSMVHYWLLGRKHGPVLLLR